MSLVRYIRSRHSGIIRYPATLTPTVPPAITQYYSNSEYDAGNAAHNMFDGGLTNGWGNSLEMPSHASWTYAAPFRALNYTMERRFGQAGGWGNDSYSPRDWFLLGTSDPAAPSEVQTDTAKWTVLDARAGQLIPFQSPAQSFAISSPGLYRSYRLLVNSPWNGGLWVNITVMTVT